MLHNSGVRLAIVLTTAGAIGFRAGIETFKEFPQRQKPASFNLDEVMRKMSESGKK